MQMIKKYLKYLIVIILFVIGIPIVINETYKINGGYLTLWGADDVLAYYGTIIAALAGAYVAVKISISSYREDTRHSNLPYIAIDTLNYSQQKDKALNNNRIINDALAGNTSNYLYFMIDGEKKTRQMSVRVTESPSELEKTPDTHGKCELEQRCK